MEGPWWGSARQGFAERPYIVPHHGDVSAGRAVRGRQRVGIDLGADLSAGLPGHAVHQPRIGDVLEEDRGDLLGLDLADDATDVLRRRFRLGRDALRRDEAEAVGRLEVPE